MPSPLKMPEMGRKPAWKQVEGTVRRKDGSDEAEVGGAGLDGSMDGPGVTGGWEEDRG